MLIINAITSFQSDQEVQNDDNDDEIWHPPASWGNFTYTSDGSDSSDCDDSGCESEEEEEKDANGTEIIPEQLDNVTRSQPKKSNLGE